MKCILVIVLVGGLVACAVPPRPATIDRAIAKELDELATAKKNPARDPEIEQALIPPLRLELPKVDGRALEPRFDLSVSAAPAQQVFLSIVTGRLRRRIHSESKCQPAVATCHARDGIRLQVWSRCQT